MIRGTSSRITTMFFFLASQAVLLWNTNNNNNLLVQGLDIHVKKIRCESRPITLSFSYICNGDYLCTFGDPESMEGYCKFDF